MKRKRKKFKKSVGEEAKKKIYKKINKHVYHIVFWMNVVHFIENFDFDFI